jgi:hypothetical protein
MPPLSGGAQTRPQPKIALQQCWTSKPAQDSAQHLFDAALDYLEANRGADDAALVRAGSILAPSDLLLSIVPLMLQDQPSAEDAWAPCIAWLLKSIPGLVIGTGEEQQQQAEGATPQPGSMPLSELLDTCGIRCVSYHATCITILCRSKQQEQQRQEHEHRSLLTWPCCVVPVSYNTAWSHSSRSCRWC